MKSDYPEILSGEQVQSILHISKRKCAWMLDNKFIKCQNTGKQTRKYDFRHEELAAYIKDSVQHPKNMSHSTQRSHQQSMIRIASRISIKQDSRPLCRQTYARGSKQNLKT